MAGYLDPWGRAYGPVCIDTPQEIAYKIAEWSDPLPLFMSCGGRLFYEPIEDEI